MKISVRSASLAFISFISISGCDYLGDLGPGPDYMGATSSKPRFSQVVVFGDSLSDAGTYNPTTADNDPSNDSKMGFIFSTKPGRPWASKLADDLGLQLRPNQQVNFGIVGQGGSVSELGGTNYAEGGATIWGDAPNGGVSMEDIPGIGLVPVQSATRRSIATQVTDYLEEHNHRFNRKQLVLIQGGANDFFAFLQQVAANPSLAEKAPEFVAKTAAAMVHEVGRVKAAAASNIIYCNLPDVGLTLLFKGTPLQALASQMSASYNATVAATLNAWNVPIFDTSALVRDLTTQPAKYGFSDASTPACNSLTTPGDPSSVSALLCTRETLVEPKADVTHVFADLVHPTSRAHSIWAAKVIPLLRSL